MPAASRTLAADAEQRGWGEEAAPTAPLVQQLELLAAGEEITSTPSPPAPTAGGPPSTAAPRRALVEEHRLRGREALTLTGLAVKIDQLRTSLHALAAKARMVASEACDHAVDIEILIYDRKGGLVGHAAFAKP